MFKWDKLPFIELPVTHFIIYSTKYHVSDWSMTNASIGTIECDTEVAMATKRWSDFVEYIINKKSYKLACAFRDLWSREMF